jgi:hypothetical protein
MEYWRPSEQATRRGCSLLGNFFSICARACEGVHVCARARVRVARDPTYYA